MQTAIVAFAAIGTGVVLLVSGALDETRHVDVDTSPSSTVVERAVIRPEDEVMVRYLAEYTTWTECVKSRLTASPAGVASPTCGTLPEQPDDPRLNSYLSAVLDWNKCAGPRLKHGGMDQAVISCGPPPSSPLGN
jgi:hypothetical protein